MKKTFLGMMCFFASAFAIKAQTLYGATSSGGINESGTIIKFTPATNNLVVVKSLESIEIDPTNFIRATDGKLYGMTMAGGRSNRGVIFSFDPSSSIYTILKYFDGANGAFPSGSLIQASDGKLYGMTSSGGNSNCGVIFSFDPSSSIYTKLKDFDGINGQVPYGNLMQASDGKLYGMANGQNPGTGVIFSFDPSSSTYTKLKDFDGTDGANPEGSLMQANDGKLYGMTSYGGNSNKGVIFSFDPASSTYIKLKDFNGTNGANPLGSFMQTNDGKLYGMTSWGGSSDAGVIFSFDPSSSTYTKLKDFYVTDGRHPYGRLMQASDGKLYGMANWGGKSGLGVIFSFDPSTLAYTYTNLEDFHGINVDDLNPNDADGGLIQANDGKLYGMTGIGDGLIFSYDPSSSTCTNLMNFGTNESGTNFSGALIQSSNGKLYGMTSRGGSGTKGIIFSFDPASSTYTKLKDNDLINGKFALGALVQGSDEKLYGISGGISGLGVIFSFDPSSSTYTKLKDFDDPTGAYPSGSLIQASDGKLYGMTENGGSSYAGFIFSFDPFSLTYTKLKDFDVANGAHPFGSLMQARDGKLYGMTFYGGLFSNGVIFSFEPSSSTYTKLKDFDGFNGGNPYSNLIQASDGKLYGMTNRGGNSDLGVIFSFDPSSSTYTKLKDFYGFDGARPSGSLIHVSDGKLYGMTSEGGSNNLGVIFSFDLFSSTYTKLIDYNGANGANPSSGSAFIELREGICPPPVIQCNADTTVNATTGKCGTTVSYSAPTVADACESTSVAQTKGLASGSLFPVGITTNTFVATSSSGQKDTCSFTVTVLDKEPPVITDVSASPSSLWPPNHQMKEVTINYTSSDNCGTVSSSLSVSSNEPVDGTGDGDTSPDWIILNDHHVQLRAERSGRGNGRVYTITITSTNASGNTSIQTTQVSVPHNSNPKMEYVDQLFNCRVIPNPSSHYFELQVNSGSDEKIVVNLYDIRGRLLSKMNTVKNQSLHFGSNLRPGTYILEILQGPQHERIYLIKQ